MYFCCWILCIEIFIEDHFLASFNSPREHSPNPRLKLEFLIKDTSLTNYN